MYQLTLIISVSTGKHLTEARMGRYSFFVLETLHNDVKKVLGFCIVLGSCPVNTHTHYTMDTCAELT